MKRLFHLAFLTVTCLLTAQLQAGDWPQFRYDVGRTAASPHDLPVDLQLNNVFKIGARFFQTFFGAHGNDRSIGFQSDRVKAIRVIYIRLEFSP